MDLSQTYIDCLRDDRHDEPLEPGHIIPCSGSPHTRDAQPCDADVSAAIDTHTAHADLDPGLRIGLDVLRTSRSYPGPACRIPDRSKVLIIG